MGVGAGLYMYDVVVKKFTFAISSPDDLVSLVSIVCKCTRVSWWVGDFNKNVRANDGRNDEPRHRALNRIQASADVRGA